ncbi:hypothetical protein DID88_000279 [Monilinia fructigena]|uniref:Protein kinase domain-containing protein n=1 Tax=Monilinia fructigena TaxID=38457 RepID=A0A395IHK6_9HELO|nr:hypothetical protein DID88_000279 [Monilinia fructigena]
MTLHTKAATDEIYDIFNQPLKPADEEEEEEREEEEEEEEESDERMMVTRLKSESEWTEFTAQKHVSDVDDGEDDTRASTFTDAEDEEFEAIKVAIPRDFEEDDELESVCRIKKYSKTVSRAGKGDRNSISAPPSLKFPGTDRYYTLKRELGAGAFAPVFLLESSADDGEQDENEAPAVMGKGAFDHFNRKSLEALKMEDPPSAWEFYIMRQAKRRLGVSRPAESIIDVYEMHLYKDECYLIEEYRDQGTLLDIINISRADAKSPGGVMDEILVMFFTIELFRTIEALHSKGILHGDLKADNCLVRFDALSDDDVWSPKYRRDGSGCWNKKGISLIDFGRGIDMKCFKPDVQFIADWKTGPQRLCRNERELRPWTYQIDYHGLAGIIHSMLFGKYIDTIAERPGGGNTDAIGGLGGGGAGLRKWKIKERDSRDIGKRKFGRAFLTSYLTRKDMWMEKKEVECRSSGA